MKNQIIYLQEKGNKVVGFDDKSIIISTKSHKSFDTLLAAVHDSGILEKVNAISFRTVKEFFYNEKEQRITIRYEENGKPKKDSVVLEDESLLEPLVTEWAELKGFEKEVSEESKIKPLLLNLLGVIIIALLTWGFRSRAVDAQNGIEYVATGRRSGLKQLLANGAEALGPTGVTIVGAVGLAIMMFITYRRYSNPASEIRFK